MKNGGFCPNQYFNLVSADDVWAVLHAENIYRSGEWIETRLLTSVLGSGG